MKRKLSLLILTVICALLLPMFVHAQQDEPQFDGELTPSDYVVRLIYFLPRDRSPRPNINTQMDRLIKDVQTFYADEMERHGFGRKTFEFESDADRNAVVHHVTGRYADTDYQRNSTRIWGEIGEQFDTSRESTYIYLAALDVSTESIDRRFCGVVDFVTSRGFINRALIPADGSCFNVTLAAHELGHTFHLPHDHRNDSDVMSQARYKNKLSKCAAEWLDVNPYFNSNDSSNRADYIHQTFRNRTLIEMLPPSLESPYGIRLRFTLNDPDGLHQAMLVKNTVDLIGCQSLNGTSSQTIDFVTTALDPKDIRVYLWVIDKRGNVTILQSFPVDIPALLSPDKPVSIPDPNLAAAIREKIGDVITTHTMLNLTELYVRNSVADLTGLEHAHRLTYLDLGYRSRGVDIRSDINTVSVSDFSPLEGLTNLQRLSLGTITDISFLANLTNLTHLAIAPNDLTDISPLANLINLDTLYLSDNNLTDISPLANLTGLTVLSLWGNNISDISPLANLTGLNELDLHGNNISDISPLANLTKLTWLWLQKNNISDVSPLANLTNLTTLSLYENNISDISPLLAFENPSSHALFVNGMNGVRLKITLILNPLNDASINTYIPALREKGIRVSYDIGGRRAPNRREDVNKDGVVNIQDLVLVANKLGERGLQPADVNWDRVVNILDLVLVADAFGNANRSGN